MVSYSMIDTTMFRRKPNIAFIFIGINICFGNNIIADKAARKNGLRKLKKFGGLYKKVDRTSYIVPILSKITLCRIVDTSKP